MIEPLKYHAGLNLQEAEERYNEVRNEFEKVKFHYSGLLKRFKRTLSEGDNKTLADCTGVLLPLGMEASVQDQVGKAQSIEDTLHYQIGQLSLQIMDYLANFKNTGVTRLQGNLDL